MAKLVKFQIKIGRVQTDIQGYETKTRCIQNRHVLLHYQFKNKGIDFSTIAHSLDACRDRLSEEINKDSKTYLKKAGSRF